MLKITILIPVFNSIKYTETCLLNIEKGISVSDFCKEEVSVIVIDDGSVDGTSNMIKEKFPDTILVFGTGSLWWSGSINAGIKKVLEYQNDGFILLWNNDILAAADYFKNLYKIISSDDLAGTIVASKIYFLHQRDLIFNMGGLFNSFSGKKSLVGYKEEDSEKYDKVVEVDWVGGMGTLIPLAVVKKIGNFDEIHFPQYHGDSDYFLRAKKAGFKVLVYPNLKIWNDKSNSGLEHKGSLKLFIQSLFSIKSNFNLKKEFMFYRIHATSPWAYIRLVFIYLKHFASFVKYSIYKNINK